MRIQTEEQLLNVKDVMYRIGKDFIEEVIITEIKDYSSHYVYKDNHGHSFFNRNVGKQYFKTREEAEEEVQQREMISKKRKILKDYELKLNDELGIKNHFVIK